MVEVSFQSALIKEFLKALMLIIFCTTLWFQLFGDFINLFFRCVAIAVPFLCVLGILVVIRYIKKLERTIQDVYGELWYCD